MNPPRIILIGAVDSTRVAFEAVVEAQCALDLLITLPPERSGMHSDFVDLAPLAARHGVEILATPNANGDAVIERVRTLNPDFIFVIGWSRLVGETLRACATKGVLGYHPAPLPKGRGRSALAWTILLGMRETAGSLFWIDEGVDSGPIAAQQGFALAPRVDLPTLYDQHMVALKEMFGDLLTRLKAGEIPSREQDASEASYFAMRRAEDGRIDWSAGAEEIDRLVRAVTRPYPGAFTECGANRLIVWSGEPVDALEWHAQTGQVFLIREGALYVRCGGGSSYRINDYELLGEDGQFLAPLKGQPRLGGIGGAGHA